MRNHRKRNIVLAFAVAAIGVAALAFHGARASTRGIVMARGPLRLKSAVLPDRCAFRIGISLPRVLSQPSFAGQPSAPMILSSVLGRTPQSREIVDRLVAATESLKLEDLTAIHACRERLDGGFAANVQGKFRKNALSSLLVDGAGKWHRANVRGLDALVSNHGAPIFAQADDGSFVVSDSEAMFGRIVDAAAAGAAPPDLAADSDVSASIWFDPALGVPVKGAPLAWEHARHLEMSANFERRSFTANLEVDDAGSAAPLASQLRVLATAAAARGSTPSGGSAALTYLIQRARVSTHSNLVSIDSELAGDSLQLISKELSDATRARADHT
jgi:hypothetical protein